MLNEKKFRILSVKKTAPVTTILLTLVFYLFVGTTSLMADGTEPTGNPRQVSTPDHLLWISTNSSSWGDSFIQMNDIDASATSGWDDGDGGAAEGFSPIGHPHTTQFTGTYDGDGYTIANLTINRSGTEFACFFGYTSGATIQDLGITNCAISGLGFGGGLVGSMVGGSLSNCFCTGSVTSDLYVGGLIGFMSSAAVSNCYSTCSVSGVSYVGGLVGFRSGGSVSNCYSAGSVSGSSEFYVGGLFGSNSIYTTDSFWDTQTSGKSSSAGGIGKTTSQMKSLATFTDTDTPD